MTRCDSDEDIERDGHVITESDTEVVRPSRRLRLMWSQDQASVDSHDERLARVRQMVQEEVRGGQPQVTHRDVHGVVELLSNFGPSGQCPEVLRCQQQSGVKDGLH